MTIYRYFPSNYGRPIKTLLLDANVTGHLDTIARKGNEFKSRDVRVRMRHLVSQLDSDVFVMPGLGAGESVLRRDETKLIENYRRRTKNAFAMFADGCKGIRCWLNESEENVGEISRSGLSEDDLTKYLKVVREDLVYPSYAIVLKAYQLHLVNHSPDSAFRLLAEFSQELYGRGTREVLLGALLLVGNSEGRQMALNIMKLHEVKSADVTLKALWNTCFDLTYSRVAVMPSLPGLSGAFETPCVFVTDDKHLGRFLEIIQPVGAVSRPRGGGITADYVHLEKLFSKSDVRLVSEIVSRGNIEAYRDPTNVGLLTRIRRYKAGKYIERLEDWFIERY